MKIAVVGSRKWTDDKPIFTLLHGYLSKYPDMVIVSGGAAGPDSYAEEWAHEVGADKLIFTPDYKRYPPKQAPVMRNTTIVEHADMLVAFWCAGSKGTEDAIRKAKKKGIPVIVQESGNG